MRILEKSQDSVVALLASFEQTGLLGWLSACCPQSIVHLFQRALLVLIIGLVSFVYVGVLLYIVLVVGLVPFIYIIGLVHADRICRLFRL